MNNQEEKQIHDWQEKIRANFGDASKLYQYLFETMDNFYYRYLETTSDKGLKTKEFAPNLWGAESFEVDMMTALKIQTKESKEIIMELAKNVPKAQHPKVRYGLTAKISELTPDRGNLLFTAEVFGLKSYKKEVSFKYNELAQFRKELALKLEDVCSIFL